MMSEIEQIDLASRSGISVGTIRNMEAQGGATLKSSLTNIKAVQEALEAAGIEFLNHGQPGVRLRPWVTLDDLTRKIETIDKHLAEADISGPPSPKQGMQILEDARKADVGVRLRNKRTKLKDEK